MLATASHSEHVHAFPTFADTKVLAHKIWQAVVDITRRVAAYVGAIFRNIIDFFKAMNRAIPPVELADIVQRDHRLCTTSEAVGASVDKQLQAATAQMEAERDESFNVSAEILQRYEDLYSGWEVTTEETQEIGDFVCATAYTQGLRPEMEDSHIAAEIALSIQAVDHRVQLFGIFDGHAGEDCAQFVAAHMAERLKEQLEKYNVDGLSQLGIANALKQTFVLLNDQYTGLAGTTATLAMIIDDHLWVANAGDARTILSQPDNTTLQLSEDAVPDAPRFKKGIEKRGGWVMPASYVTGPARVEGNVAVARAIGDKGLPCITARPKLTCIPMAQWQPGAFLVLACDGLYDVASTREVGTAVRAGEDTLPIKASKLVKAALANGSQDNISAMLVQRRL